MTVSTIQLEFQYQNPIIPMRYYVAAVVLLPIMYKKLWN